MKPIFFNVNHDKPLMVIPKAIAQVDGHPVLTYSYAIYNNAPDNYALHLIDTDNLLAPGRTENPDYMGTLFFEQLGKLFFYTANGKEELSTEEIREIIEQLTHYRENPKLWSI